MCLRNILKRHVGNQRSIEASTKNKNEKSVMVPAVTSSRESRIR